MAQGVNKVILVGHLGKDPDIKVFENVKNASFTVATDESYKDKEGNKIDKVEWHNVSTWRSLAEIVEKYLHKGSKVYIEGKLRTRTYQDETGKNRYFTEVVADNMVMLDKKEGSGMAQQPPLAPPAMTPDPFIGTAGPVDDDLPF